MTNQPEVMKVQSGLGRPEQRWRGPTRGKIALWSVLPGAAIVIVVGGLFWASMWIAFRTPSVTVASTSSDLASAAVPSDDAHDNPVAAAPISINGTVSRDGQDDEDDQDLMDDLAMANKPADADTDAWSAAHRPLGSDGRDVAADGDASDDRMAPNDRIAADDGTVADDPPVANNRATSDERPVADGRIVPDDRTAIDGQDAPDDQVVADRPDDDADQDDMAVAGPFYGPEFGPEQLAAVLAGENPGDDDGTGDQLANAGSQATDRADEIAARAGELTVRAEELTARIDGLTAKIEELQAKLETSGTALMVQPSPVPVVRTSETVAARNGQTAQATATATPVPGGRAPWVVLPQPEPGSRVAAGPVVLETRARGAAPITQIRLQIDGMALQVALDRRDDTTWRGRATTRVSPGSHTVAVAVVDGQGRVGSYQWKFDASPS